MNLLHLFDASLRGRASGPGGLEFGGRSFSFGEIDARSNRVANLLVRSGLRAGDRLAVYLPNGLAIIDLFLACAKSGIIFVPVNILYREREIAHIVEDARPAAIIAAADPGATGVPFRDLASLAAEAEREADDRPASCVDGDAPAAIIYTSGTTGASKGAVLTHNSFLANTANLVACWQISERDRFLLPLPLFHVHGLGNGLCSWLATGCSMRLLERFDHNRAEQELLDFEPTLFFGVPTIYVRLLGISEAAARRIGSRMRLFVSGSAPLPAEVLERFRALYGQTILERYGMSETLMTISNPYAGERRPGAVGLPLPGVSIRIVDDEGLEAGEGETGELLVRSPTLFAGYWNREDATRAAFRDGWFATGDLAERSADGYVTLRGRKSDLIISGGFNIYPREIEEFLAGQHGVSEAAVVGVPDEIRGEVPVAFIVGEFDPKDLERECRRHLASFKVPRRFIRAETIPRTALGKVQKHLLREMEMTDDR